MFGARWHGGSRHPNSGPKMAAACPSAPTLIRSSAGLPLPHSVDGSFHDTSPSIFSCLPSSVFPDEPGWASNPGDGSIPYGTGNPAPSNLLPPCEEAPR